MYFVNLDNIEHINLTYVDERNLATMVMDTLALRRIAGGFATLLEQLYIRKCSNGLMIRTDDVMALLDYCERYKIIAPVFEDSQGSIWTDLDGLCDTKEDRLMEMRRMVIKAWKEVWETHHEFQAISNSYKSFPGDGVREYEARTGRNLDEEQQELDTMFWAEVDRLEGMYKTDGQSPSRTDIITQVSDYIPRNVMDLE